MNTSVRISDFSAEELLRRLDRVREAVRRRGLDALVIYDEDRPLGGASVQYLTGYHDLQNTMTAAAVVPMQGEPILCLSPGFAFCNLSWAELVSPYSVRSTTAPLHGNRFGPNFVQDIPDALRQSGFDRGRVGIDGIRIMPAGVLDGLRGRLTNCELVDATGLVEDVRISKSEAEVEVIRRANAIGRIAIDAFADAARSHADQGRAVAEGESAARAQGAEDVSLLVAAGTPWLWGGRRRRGFAFQDGDIAVVEVFDRYHGYYGHICRTVLVGAVDSEKQRWLDAEKAAHEKMLERLKPGVTAEELFRVGREAIEAMGYEHSGMRYGHGVGMAANEGFVIAEGDTTVLPEGAYGVLHPMMIKVDDTGRGLFNVLWGDPWVLRTHGPELLV